jgi:CBS domain containing-hemolysin-like protein
VEKLRLGGSTRGKLLAKLRRNMDRPVSAILTLNTIAHTTGATVAGSLVQIYYGSQWLSIFSGVFVFAILVFSEIIPKTLGVYHANRLAPLFAIQIQILVWALYPAVILSEWITRLFKPKAKEKFPTEDDILSVASLGVRSGGILPEEHKWLQNVLHLNNVQAKDMMTPREKFLFLKAEDSVGKIKEESKEWGHRFLPLFDGGDLEKPAGAVSRLGVVAAIRDGRDDAKLSELAREAEVVPPSKPGHELLQEMIQKHQELFIVADAVGKTVGLVTLEDVIEEMLGMEID